MRLLIPFLLLALILTARISWAAPSLPLPPPTIPPSAISTALLALTVSLDVVAIGYVLSKIFPQTGIGDWLAKEYWEIFKSAMLIVSIFAVITIVTNVALLLVPSTGTCSSPISIPANYLLTNAACGYLTSVSGQLSDTFNYLLGLSSSFGALDSLQISAYAPIPVPFVGFESGFTLMPYQNSLLEGSAGGQLQAILSDSITLIAFPVALLIQIQLNMLPFLFVLGLTILIPIGLVMRAFPFIRGIGGALMAVGLAISVIYPSLLILLNYPVTQMLQVGVFQSQASSCNSSIICGILQSVLATFSSGGEALLSFDTIFPALNGILAYNSYVVLQFILFILDLGIGFSITSNVAHMLGGDIRLSIGGKLKLA